MISEVLRGMDVAVLMKTGLVIFFAVFVAIVLWAVSRPGGQVERWASLPLADQAGEGKEDLP